MSGTAWVYIMLGIYFVYCFYWGLTADRAAGAKDFLSNPYNVKLLLNEVRVILDNR